jgi:adenosylcobinamide-GDP ribazoletransferase
MLLVGVWWHRKINYWLDGYTGDTLGAMQQMAEIAFYFGLVLWSMSR